MRTSRPSNGGNGTIHPLVGRLHPRLGLGVLPCPLLLVSAIGVKNVKRRVDDKAPKRKADQETNKSRKARMVILSGNKSNTENDCQHPLEFIVVGHTANSLPCILMVRAVMNRSQSHCLQNSSTGVSNLRAELLIDTCFSS